MSAVANQGQSRRTLSTPKLVVTIFACLVVAHLAIATYFPSVAVNTIGLVAVTVILGTVILVKGDLFAGLLAIFFCSQFQFATNRGGLFNLVAFLLLLLYLVLKSANREIPRSPDVTIGSLLAVLFLSNLAGLLVRNPMSMEFIGLQAAAFAGMLLAFYLAGSLRLTEARLRQLLAALSIMAAYNFLVSLNQQYGILFFDTPLLGLNPDLFYRTTNSFGTFGSASANGQYAMMLLALMLPLIAASASKASLRLRPLYFVPAVIMCGLTLILANMRAAAIESVVIVLIYTIMFSVMYRRSFRNAKHVNMASGAAILLLMTAGVWFGLQNIEEDFQRVQVTSVESISSGKALNRFGPWQVGWQRLQQESWWIGYGHGVDASNQLAWGGSVQLGGKVAGGGHLHNLYLALPMLYGWAGAIAYVLLFLVVTARLIGAVRRYRFDNLMVVTCLGFAVSLVFFLLDELKSGNAVQTINFAMVAWIWLGLALAAFRTLKYELALARARQAQPEVKGEAAGDGASAPPDEDGDVVDAPGEPG